MYNNTTYTLFLELLSAAIWNRPANAALFTSVDEKQWQIIAHNSALQRVHALISDGVATLPNECKPPKSVKLSLALAAEQTVKANIGLNDALANISKEYDKEGFAFALLKGQGNALYYPQPLHRTSGDLDLYLYRGNDYQRAKQWVKKNGYPHEAENLYHMGFYRGKSHIENHRSVIHFTNEKYNKRLEKHINRIIEENAFETVTINGVAVKVLPATFNALYVFSHLFHHFIHTGIGFRQVCDWLLLLQHRKKEIDKNEFEALAQEFDLLTAMRVLAHACIKHMDASPDLFPFAIGEDSRYSDLLMDDILQGGHFGLHRFGVNSKGGWVNRWLRYKKSVSRSFVFGAIAPSHIRVLPFTKILMRIKLTLKGS